MTIRVLVADDQEIVRTGLAMILDAQPGIEVVGEAARRAARRWRWPASCAPTCACSTSGCPSSTGSRRPGSWPGRTSRTRSRSSSSRRSTSTSTSTARCRAGARGFLLKDAGPELLAQAVHAAADGDALIAPSVTVAAAGRVRRRRTGAAAGAAASSRSPTARRRCWSPSPAGRTNAEIADELHISLSTVKTHLASLMDKLGARNRVEIAMWAYETGRITA